MVAPLARRPSSTVIIGLALAVIVLVVVVFFLQKGPEKGTPRVLPKGTWTQYHGDGTHAAGAASSPLPPFHQAWMFAADKLHARGVDGWFRGSFGAPVIADGMIALVGDKLYGLTTDGDLMWRVEPPPHAGFFEPVVLGTNVIVPTLVGNPAKVQLLAVDIHTGNEAWTWEAPAAGAQWVWLTSNNDGVLVVTSPGDRRIWFLGADGHERWASQMQSAVSQLQQAPPAAVDDRVAVINGNNLLEAHALDDGALLWSGVTAVSGSSISPAIVGDQVIEIVAGSPSGELESISLADGEVTRITEGADVGSFIAGNGYIVARVADFGYVVYDNNLKKVWELPREFATTALTITQLPLGDGVLFAGSSIGTSDFTLWYLGRKSEWHAPLTIPTPGFRGGQNPWGVVTDGSKIYVSNAGGILLAFEPGEEPVATPSGAPA